MCDTVVVSASKDHAGSTYKRSRETACQSFHPTKKKVEQKMCDSRVVSCRVVSSKDQAEAVVQILFSKCEQKKPETASH
jgi:hypothetical protein